MPRFLVAALVALAVALPGCLEDGDPGGGGAADEPPFEEPFRELGGGTGASQAAATLVIESEDAWAAFWEDAHADCVEPDCPGVPEVDFSEERVLAVVLGQKPNACWGVEIAGVTTAPAEGATTVTYAVREPPPDAFCASVIVNPWDAVAVAARDTVVRFERVEADAA